MPIFTANINSMSEAKPETQKPEKAELPKVNPDSYRVQNVYRLPNGEWEDFAELAEIDKSKFYKVFHREMRAGGELVEEVEYDQDGNEVQRTKNIFGDKGKITLHELYNEGVLAEKLNYEYDEKDRVAKEIRQFEEGFPLTTIYTYDDQDRIIEKRIDDDEGELQKREVFEYHPEWKDKIVRHQTYDEEGKLSIDEKIQWEERNGLVKTKQFISEDHTFKTKRRTEFFDPKTREDQIAYAVFNDKDKVVEYVKIIYDEQGREAEEHSFSVNDSDTFKIYYTYDEKDRIIGTEQHQQDKIISKINRRYGSRGHAELIAIRSFNRGMYVDYFEYEFFG